jgi:hypothetical protein
MHISQWSVCKAFGATCAIVKLASLFCECLLMCSVQCAAIAGGMNLKGYDELGSALTVRRSRYKERAS